MVVSGQLHDLSPVQIFNSPYYGEIPYAGSRIEQGVRSVKTPSLLEILSRPQNEKTFLALLITTMFFVIIYYGFWFWAAYNLMKANHETELKVIRSLGVESPPSSE